MKNSTKWPLGVLLGSIAAYTAAVALLYTRQTKILFQPSVSHPLRHLFLEKFGHRAHEYNLVEDNFPKLTGWWMESEEPSDTIIIYFGGNAENIDTLIFIASNLPEVHMLAMHYRGYGLSEGEPSEESLFEDAIRIVDHIHSKYPKKKIILFGRSLGSGIALYAAKERPTAIDHIILSTPYDSIAAVAKRHYSWVPINTLLRHKFDALKLAPFIKNPVTILIAGQDMYIPLEHAKKLAAELEKNTSVEWYTVEHADHSNIHDWNETWRYVRQALGLDPTFKKTTSEEWLTDKKTGTIHALTQKVPVLLTKY